MSDFFKVSKDSRGVATITLNRPDIHNAFNDEMIIGLTQKIREMETDESLRVLILTGNGKSFCAGADLNWMKKMKDYSSAENYEDSLALAGLFHTINNFPCPVIGKINGASLGGGAGLVAACDYVVAHESAKFGFTEVRLGLVPAVISPFVMAKIGESQARAYFLSGERFDSEEAKRIGLVHKVSLDRHFHNDVENCISEFLKAGPKAQRAAKDLIRNVLHFNPQGKEAVTDFTCKTISQIRISEEGQDGMTALLEKRKPSWLK
ncbi:MAG: enoyl-CoA hydratase/isomerase family protein [Bacteriovoracaceae bacterium]|nr:enoyl-CoA hydratase/isomerase family protein [Bacteriovoracaceae bacterium]